MMLSHFGKDVSLNPTSSTGKKKIEENRGGGGEKQASGKAKK